MYECCSVYGGCDIRGERGVGGHSHTARHHATMQVKLHRCFHCLTVNILSSGTVGLCSLCSNCYHARHSKSSLVFSATLRGCWTISRTGSSTCASATSSCHVMTCHMCRVGRKTLLTHSHHVTLLTPHIIQYYSTHHLYPQMFNILLIVVFRVVC